MSVVERCPMSSAEAKTSLDSTATALSQPVGVTELPNDPCVSEQMKEVNNSSLTLNSQ